MKGSLSNWRDVRVKERALRDSLRQRHWLRVHGVLIGMFVMAAMWAVAHMQRVLGSPSMALRYAVTLGAGYLVYLLVLRIWAWNLVRQRSGPDGSLDLGIDLPGGGSGGGGGGSAKSIELPAWRSGGGGDFGGGGASADFDAPGSSVGDALGGVGELIGGADEGAVVVIPVVAIFLVGIALVVGCGSLLMLYFGWEALMAVAVELAFGYVSARTAIRVVREGWLQAAVRLTCKPLLGALFAAVLLGATLDVFLPTAESLPQAMRMIRAAL